MDVHSSLSRTVCEVNCRLLTLEKSSDPLPGPACPDICLGDENIRSIDAVSVSVRSPSGTWPGDYCDAPGQCLGLQQLATTLISKLPSLNAGVPPGLTTSPTLAWDSREPLLATVDSLGRTHVYDFTAHIPYLGQQQDGVPPPLAPSITLQHDLQRCSEGGAPLAWRPAASTTLAVGCNAGVCLWQFSKHEATMTGSHLEVAASSLIWLNSPEGVAVRTMAWHPRGHTLAAASSQRPGFFLWDVATGSFVVVRGSMEDVSLLRWSPCGMYVFAGSPSGSFRLWEAATWTSATWTVDGEDFHRSPANLIGKGQSFNGSTPNTALIGAEWSPDGKTVLVAHASGLSTLHLTGSPPALSAQVLPVNAPELFLDREGASQLSMSLSGGSIKAMGWDPRGQRLAVLFADGGRDSNPAALVALYDTRCDPILTTRFIGYARIAIMDCAGRTSDAEEIEPEWEIIEADGAHGQEEGGGAGAGSSSMIATDTESMAMGLAFLPQFKQGAVLSLRHGDFVGTLPMYFTM